MKSWRADSRKRKDLAQRVTRRRTKMRAEARNRENLMRNHEQLRWNKQKAGVSNYFNTEGRTEQTQLHAGKYSKMQSNSKE